MEKPSHLHAPRTLGECNFYAAADPIERHVVTGYSLVWWFIMSLIAAIGAALVWVQR